MSLEERASELAELTERFGGGLLDMLRKRREKKEREAISFHQPSITKGKEREGIVLLYSPFCSARLELHVIHRAHSLT